MIPQLFDALLTGRLGTRLVWMRAHRCPCTDVTGAADYACPICSGKGRYWDAPSAEFRAGVTGLTARALEAMRQQFGQGFVGDARVSIPSTSPAYEDVGEADRFLSLDNLDTVEWPITAGSSVKVPTGATIVSAYVRQGASLQAVTPPDPDEDGRITVNRTTVVTMRAPRMYEVVQSLPQTRAWQSGLPKVFPLKLVDVTVR